MATVKWVSGDTAPILPIYLVQSDGVTPYDLTGCTVRFRIMDPDTTTEVNSNSNNSCTVVSPSTGGEVTYQFNSTDTPAAKSYQCDVEITTATGKVSTPFEQIILAVRSKN